MDIHISSVDVEETLHQLRYLNGQKSELSEVDLIKRGGEAICDLLNAAGLDEVTRAYRKLY